MYSVHTDSPPHTQRRRESRLCADGDTWARRDTKTSKSVYGSSCRSLWESNNSRVTRQREDKRKISTLTSNQAGRSARLLVSSKTCGCPSIVVSFGERQRENRERKRKKKRERKRRKESGPLSPCFFLGAYTRSDSSSIPP